MRPTARKPKVIIRHCDAYDAERIRAIVREGMEALDLRPRGRTLLVSKNTFIKIYIFHFLINIFIK
jgi:hypothetical protein